MNFRMHLSLQNLETQHQDRSGRLTLNPKAHLDFFGFILMMFTNIGWGKPVQINPNNFTSNKSRSFCEIMVSLAGPISNLILAIIFTVIKAILYLYFRGFENTAIGLVITEFVEISISVNIGLGVFNLIPLPPLDGEKIFSKVMPYKVQNWLNNNYYTLYYIFMILWLFGVLSYIVSPVINAVSYGIQWVVYKIFMLF